MAASKGMAKAKGRSAGGRVDTSKGPKNPHTQVGNKDRKGRGR
jgi:hypothetical protein